MCGTKLLQFEMFMVSHETLKNTFFFAPSFLKRKTVKTQTPREREREMHPRLCRHGSKRIVVEDEYYYYDD